MLAAQVMAQQAEHVKVALVLLALGIVAFWRLALRALLAIFIIAAGAGALVLLHVMLR
jgi:hypothetical protein